MPDLRYVSWADNTGYALAAKALIKALVAQGDSVAWQPVVPSNPAGPIMPDSRVIDDPVLASTRDESATAPITLVHLVPDYYPRWVERVRAEGGLIYGYIVWEFETLPAHWPGIINQLDGLLVPTQWNAEIFRCCGVRVPVAVIPHLPEPAHLDDAGAGAEDSVEEARHHRFYTIGQYNARKGMELLIEAYYRAFTSTDSVELLIKTTSLNHSRTVRAWRHGFRRRCESVREAIRRIARHYPDRPTIRLIDDERQPAAAIARLHREGDCFVSLARTEGWGLGAFEAAHWANPVIMPGWGGHTTFLDEDCYWPVRYSLVPTRGREIRVGESSGRDTGPGHKRWAEPDIDHAAAQMRAVMTRRDEAKRRARELARRLDRRYARESVVSALRQATGMGV